MSEKPITRQRFSELSGGLTFSEILLLANSAIKGTSDCGPDEIRRYVDLLGLWLSRWTPEHSEYGEEVDGYFKIIAETLIKNGRDILAKGKE